jgi:hypothetical protein
VERGLKKEDDEGILTKENSRDKAERQESIRHV